MMSGSTNITLAESSVIAREMARRQALKAMGISVYVSRYDLPGAAPSVRGALGQSEPPSPPTAEVVTSTPTRTAMTDSRRPAAPEGKTPLVASAKLEPVRFSMLLASAGPFLWIEQLADGLIRQDQLALINAMARALVPNGKPIMQQQFDWPMQGNSALGRDAESAKQALHGLIQRMAREAGAKRVVVMGECVFLPDRLAQSAVAIPSTMTMLSDASTKADAWTALKPLKAIESD